MKKDVILLKEEGNSLFRKGEYEKALERYSIALEIEESSVILLNKAVCFLKLKQFDSVLKCCESALCFADVDSEKAFYLKSIAYRDSGLIIYAWEIVEKSLSLNHLKHYFVNCIEVILRLLNEEFHKRQSVDTPCFQIERANSCTILHSVFALLLQEIARNNKQIQARGRKGAQFLRFQNEEVNKCFLHAGFLDSTSPNSGNVREMIAKGNPSLLPIRGGGMGTKLFFKIQGGREGKTPLDFDCSLPQFGHSWVSVVTSAGHSVVDLSAIQFCLEGITDTTDGHPTFPMPLFVHKMDKTQCYPEFTGKSSHEVYYDFGKKIGDYSYSLVQTECYDLDHWSPPPMKPEDWGEGQLDPMELFLSVLKRLKQYQQLPQDKKSDSMTEEAESFNIDMT